MTFDIPTLIAAGALVTGISGLLLFFAWLADRTAQVLLWWSGAAFVSSAGIALIIAVGTGGEAGVGGQISSALLALSPALAWTSARVFNERPPRVLLILLAPVLSVAGGAALAMLATPATAIALNLGVTSAYLVVAAFELTRRRAEVLRARPVLIGFIVIHAAVFAIGAIEALLSLWPNSALVPLNNWFGVIHFEQIIFAMGSAIFLVAMVREQSELRHRTAARVDVLTHVATRRAFFEKAEDQLTVCLAEETPLSLVIFDLDRFKQVNDTHGHGAGDVVLQTFTQVARNRLRATDSIGRIGGEEFAVVMPGSSPGAAYVIADRIRVAFAEAETIAGKGQSIRVTVSAGIASAHPRSTLHRLMEDADEALYRAKANGRNRVEVAGRENRDNGSDKVIRVA